MLDAPGPPAPAAFEECANVLLFCETFKAAAAAAGGAYPRGLTCASMAKLPPLCQEAGQRALLDLFPLLDRALVRVGVACDCGAGAGAERERSGSGAGAERERSALTRG